MCFSFQDPPRIEGSGGTTDVSVVVNHVLELHCEASGIPPPSLTWLKDGRPLPQTDSLQLLRGGELLRVASAQVGRLPAPTLISKIIEDLRAKFKSSKVRNVKKQVCLINCTMLVFRTRLQ